MRASSELPAERLRLAPLWQRLSPFGAPTELPSIAYLLTRSSVVASMIAARERHAAATASLYLRIPVADLRLMAFDKVDEIAARGYEATREAIRSWSDARTR